MTVYLMIRVVESLRGLTSMLDYFQNGGSAVSVHRFVQSQNAHGGVRHTSSPQAYEDSSRRLKAPPSVDLELAFFLHASFQ